MEERLISYLLGELSEQEQIRLESEYLGDKEKFELLQVARDDLMDAYVAGKLSADKRKQFETHLLDSPGQRQQVDFAEVLTEYMAKREGADAQAAAPAQKKDSSIWESIMALWRARNFVLQFSLAAIA